MLGDTITRPMAVSVPITMPAMMPPVLQRFQYSVMSTQGKLAEAATAKAKATRWATFWPLAAMPMPIAIAPTTTVAMRAALTCSAWVACWPRITPT